MVRFSRLVLLPFAVLLLALSSGGPGVAAPSSEFNYSENGYAILDPAHASPYRINDERLILAIQECLTVLDAETGKATPGAAESWSPSADGRTWTFKLRKGALWSDGSPVTAKDFVRSWVRIMDPFTESPWTWLFRSIQGCAVISDNSARADGFVALRNGLKVLTAANPNGVPGESLLDLLQTTGVRPFLEGVKGRSLSRMLKWKSGDLFPPEMVKKAISALSKQKKKVRNLYRDALEAFGKAGSGVEAKDDLTLIVRTHGAAPFLPELLARSAFAPLHASVEHLRGKAFEAQNYVTNGPFLLAGRGAKPPENEPNKRTLSVVELLRNPKYQGPNPAQVEHIKCFTDQDESGQSGKEDVRRYETGDLQWINATWPEFPVKKLRKKIKALEGYTERSTPTVLFMRLRCDRAPFKDKEARRAFALAMDRSSLAKRFWPGGDPAFRLVPPGIEGRTDGISCPRPDSNGAKAAFKAAALDSDLWLEIVFGEAPGHDDVARTLVNGWKKTLGVEPPGFQITPENEIRNILRAGGYQVMLTAYRGFVDDPYAYLAPLHSGDADSGLGWRDAAFDALIDAAGDPDLALEDPEGWLKKVGRPELSSALTAAKGSQEGRARLRREALAAAERRALDEFVIVPLLFLKEATLLRGAKGLGSDEARRNPGFVGSLSSVRR